MRYPVGNTGSKEEFDKDWYIAQGFGNPTTYGFHEGADINLKTGGDTDLGKELKSIAKGNIIYFHYASHPTINFGRHIVVRIDGTWGTRWAHFAHCLDTGFLNSVQDVSEGKVIAYLGKSGTTAAHLHFSIFKVDPVSIGGIDTIAKTQQQLNDWWEDPIAFIDKWTVAPVPEPVITDQTRIPQIDNMEVQAIRSERNDMKNQIASLQSKIDQAKNILAG